MAQRRTRMLLGLCGAVLATFGLLGTGEAANCGDTAGPSKSRIACACGDSVVTSTRLRATDPVVTTACTTDEGLIIDADHITLDCRGLAIHAVEFGLHGIVTERNGVTIQNCTVQFFIDGIETLGNSTRILNNVALDTFGGFVVFGDDNRIEGNRSKRAFLEGIVVLGGLRTLVTRNQATHCFVGLVFSGERGWITNNVMNENEAVGIGVDGSRNFLFGNTAIHNGDAVGPQSGHGFVVEATGNTLIGNFANGNEGKGFCVIPGNIGVLNIALGNGATPEADFHCEPE